MHPESLCLQRLLHVGEPCMSCLWKIIERCRVEEVEGFHCFSERMKTQCGEPELGSLGRRSAAERGVIACRNLPSHSWKKTARILRRLFWKVSRPLVGFLFYLHHLPNMACHEIQSTKCMKRTRKSWRWKRGKEMDCKIHKTMNPLQSFTNKTNRTWVKWYCTVK